MKYKSYPIQIWFLDDDLQKSAEALTNKTLMHSIEGCYQALNATYLYFIGIRSKTFYKYYFAKERVHETKDRLFPLWPLRNTPTFQNYSSRTSKWCRQCLEHYEYVKMYMSILLNEYEFRFGKTHGMSKYLDWIEVDQPKIDIPEAHLKKISIPWKNLNPRWRRKNLVEGYRLQLMNSFEGDDPYKAYANSKRDLPEFVISYFKLNLANFG